ncbi:CNNM domain-containing protein [Dietzia kunjamensis]|jgi:CBS domain containing-hemolysin-like protein|uniref:CNNM domain-containing protein n=1 Tax=Dietzia maris TaxID=37915 RepID=A0AAE4QYY1_9ACTN|nr:MULTISPECIES: CNNM domain-containing protein [Dietzia]MCT1433357.1 CNNM domain-containing protein [Dietzia maris]MCT1520593.1 CNNM domain-containing protein [Dietzia maris]MCY1658446.1 CNNM domain-containing protein [Dietzia sp. SL131]MCZ4655761.1 CNNM domain-containing protein [Dietzia kunjamensis]MDV6300595.1 CNNM domain-containing protein [Dietzia maris]
MTPTTTLMAAEAQSGLMSNPWVVLAATVLLIAASAFFVAVEFSLISARRHRLEDAAATSRAARAALRNASELTLLLAGAQLGITLCALALGSITKPAVHHWLTPVFSGWGLPLWTADVIAFILALIIVTFLHLVVGEMAPKSWSITHPEYSATLLAIPMRAFLWLTRPLLVALNAMANNILHRLGVESRDEVSAGQDADSLRELVRHSGEAGTLDDTHQRQLLSALELQELTVGDLLGERGVDTPASPEEMSSVGADATPGEIRDTARRTGHLRLLVLEDDTAVGVVHARDAIDVEGPATARELMRSSLSLEHDLTVAEAFRRMRDARAHLVVVEQSGGHPGTHVSEVRGVLTLDDVVRRLLPVTSG